MMMTIIPYSLIGRIELDMSNKKTEALKALHTSFFIVLLRKKEWHTQCYSLKEAGLSWNVLHAALSVESSTLLSQKCWSL